MSRADAERLEQERLEEVKRAQEKLEEEMAQCQLNQEGEMRCLKERTGGKKLKGRGSTSK